MRGGSETEIRRQRETPSPLLRRETGFGFRSFLTLSTASTSAGVTFGLATGRGASATSTNMLRRSKCSRWLFGLSAIPTHSRIKGRLKVSKIA